MKDSTTSVVTKKPVLNHFSYGLLQRKCACGNHMIGGASCAECDKKKNALQRIPDLQHKENQGDKIPTIVNEVLHSSGQPLDTLTRISMESKFGHDFSQVRVHTDSHAAESARAVDALAYTVGSDVVFGAGQYQPNSWAGQKLIAHELVHTIQQLGTPSTTDVSHVSLSNDSSEIEAEQIADSTMNGNLSSISSSSVVLARQSDPDIRKQYDDVPGPSPRLPGEEEEKFEEASSRPRGRIKSDARSTWGWGSPETNNQYQECSVAPMARDRFLKFYATLPKQPPKPQRKKPTDGPKFPVGATWPNLKAAVAPEIIAESVNEEGKTLFRIKPTHAEMAPIKSAYSQAEIFTEGEAVFIAYEASGQRVCPNLGGIAPLMWQITEDGAKKIWAGEMEHCSDIRAAFDVTLAIYASAINNEAAAERRYSTDKKAIDETKKRLQSIPLDPVDMLNAYGQEIEKTRLRDTLLWHEGITSKSLKPQENNCKGYLGIFDANSFPEIGDGPGKEKHPSEEVFKGPPAKTKSKP